jgi:hypothetical protein
MGYIGNPPDAVQGSFAESAGCNDLARSMGNAGRKQQNSEDGEMALAGDQSFQEGRAS